MVMIQSILKPVIVYAPIYNSWTGGGRKTRSSFKAILDYIVYSRRSSLINNKMHKIFLSDD